MPDEQLADRLRERARFFARPSPAGYGEEWAELLAQPPVPQMRRSDKRIVFRMRHVMLALPSKLVRSVSPLLPLCRLPQYTSSAFLGLVALGGEIAPCCSLAHLLHLPGVTVETTARTIVLQQRPGELWAFPADEVRAVATGTDRPRSEDDPCAEIGEEWGRSVFEGEDGALAVLLEPELLFATMASAVA